MNRRAIKESIKSAIPDISLLRKLVSKKRIAKLRRLIPAEEVTRAEREPLKKEPLVQEYALKHPERYKRDEQAIDKLFLQAPAYFGLDEAEKDSIRLDMHFCRDAYGFMPVEYLAFDLREKSEAERRSFISEYEHQLFYYKMNDLVAAQSFNDKMTTYKQFKPYYRREVVSLESEKDYAAFQRFVREHPVFVKKEVYESCGKSVARVDLAACGQTEQELFRELISHGKTVLEEIVVQNSVTEVFNSSSVNTIRLITFNTKHGIEIPYAFMKVGRAGSFIDNGGAGGILVGIDEKTGVLNTRGIDELHREFDVHPDTGVPFVGHRLPKWDQLLSMCREISQKKPKVGYIGWDFAYTVQDEWVVIEGNGLSQFIGPQTVWQRGIKSEVEALMRDMNLMA